MDYRQAILAVLRGQKVRLKPWHENSHIFLKKGKKKDDESEGIWYRSAVGSLNRWLPGEYEVKSVEWEVLYDRL